MTTGFRSDVRVQHSALTAALKMLKAEKRQPGDEDRPPASTLLGREAKFIPGQLVMELGDDVD